MVLDPSNGKGRFSPRQSFFRVLLPESIRGRRRQCESEVFVGGRVGKFPPYYRGWSNQPYSFLYCLRLVNHVSFVSHVQVKILNLRSGNPDRLWSL